MRFLRGLLLILAALISTGASADIALGLRLDAKATEQQFLSSNHTEKQHGAVMASFNDASKYAELDRLSNEATRLEGRHFAELLREYEFLDAYRLHAELSRAFGQNSRLELPIRADEWIAHHSQKITDFLDWLSYINTFSGKTEGVFEKFVHFEKGFREIFPRVTLPRKSRELGAWIEKVRTSLTGSTCEKLNSARVAQ